MERNELKGKQTPGTWEIGYDNDTGPWDDYFIEWATAGPARLDIDSKEPIKAQADAALIAEAGAVANETGMWPLDMVERIKELEGMLRTLRSAVKLQAVKEGVPFCDELREAYNAANYILNKKS